MDKVLKTLKENANKATSILLTAIPQIGSMDWTETLHNMKVSTIFEQVWGGTVGRGEGKKCMLCKCMAHDTAIQNTI